MTNITISSYWVKTMLSRKSNNGSRYAAVGKKGTVTYLLEQYKILAGLPLNSRLPEETALEIKAAYEESVMDTTSSILANCQSVRIMERRKSLAFDKEGKVSHAKEITSIVGTRTELDTWDSLNAAYTVRSSIQSSKRRLEEQKALLSDKQEESLAKLTRKLAEVDKFIHVQETLYKNSTPMNSSECYDDETEIRAAMNA